jgi:cytochrome c-type biogenesis protein CcmH
VRVSEPPPPCYAHSSSPSRGGFLAFFALLLAAPAFAQSGLPPARYAYTQLEDPRQEAEAKALMETLRCLVCQGQSIADSDAEMAGDMRALVRERIAAGEKPEAIRAWLVERYGQWVSYKPGVEPITWPLWAAPLLLLAAGAWLARGRFRRRRR